MSMSNKMFKSEYIAFIFTCTLFLPVFAAAQQSFPEIGIQTFTGSKDNIPTNSLNALNTGSPVNLWRYPAEERQWVPMIDQTAYFRDVLAGATMYIFGTADEETWDVTGQTPDGSTIKWPTITYYSSSKCFISSDGSWSACGSESALVLWYVSAQCQQSGLWNMIFYNKGNYLFTAEFTLLPQINPGKVPLFNQGAYSNAYDSICFLDLPIIGRTNVPCWVPLSQSYTIKQKGCALTSAAMILGYHGVSVLPSTLNTWLTNYKDSKGKPLGYDPKGGIYWGAVSAYAKSVGKTVSYLGYAGVNDVKLENNICKYGPQVAGVKPDNNNHPTHWVTPSGRDADKTTFLINDPNGGIATTLSVSYNKVYQQLRFYGGPEYIYTDVTGITIRFHSPGELLITDPQGRRTGYDPVSGLSYDEIPNSSYSTFYIEDAESGDPGPETKEIDIRQPVVGNYQLRVTGTGTGTYTLEAVAYDPDLNGSEADIEEVPITPGEIHSYDLYYAKTAGAEIVFTKAVDTVPPVTVASATPAANANGWNNTNVTINLSSTDNESGGTGVKEIHVLLSGAQTGTTIIQGGIGSVVVSAEGITTVTYYAVDNAGNIETAKTLTIKLDKTPPMIEGMPAQGCTLWPPDHKLVQVASMSTMDIFSGLSAFNVNVISSEPTDSDIVITGSPSQPQVVQLRAERLGTGPGRVYVITATASDLSGNSTTATATCTVPHDQGQ